MKKIIVHQFEREEVFRKIKERDKHFDDELATYQMFFAEHYYRISQTDTTFMTFLSHRRY